MVVVDDLVVALLVIESIVVLELSAALDLLSRWRPNEIDLWIVEDLFLFIVG